MKPISLTLCAAALALSGLVFLAPLHAAPLSPVEAVPAQPMTASPVTLTPLPAATAPAMSDADAKIYVLSPDDVVEISVLGHEDLKAEVTILPDGTFNYPVIGTVHAAGQTVAGLTRTLTKGLSKIYNQPEVTVYLRQGRLRRISVSGDGIKTTGQFEFRTGMHVQDLVTAAGGLSEEPYLVDGTLVTNDGQKTILDMEALMSGDMKQNLPLAPGDQLYLRARNPELAEVQVEGQVTKPGSYNIMPSGISILALLNQAGGALPTARLTKVQIKHDGMVQVVNLLPLLNSDLTDPAGNIRLMPGDVILIPQNKNVVLALGEIRSTGVLSIPDDQPLTLTKAYALVGGATPDGDKKNVNVIRRTPSGQAQLLTINMEDVLKGKNGVTDITMQPDDIMFVQTRNHPKSLGDILSTVGTLGSLGYFLRTGI